MLGVSSAIAIGLAAIAALHFWWRDRFHKARLRAESDLKAARELAERQRLGAEARQQALFDSMVEGLLILDHQTRITLANKAFLAYFAPPAPPRGKTILETLRLNELQGIAATLCRGEKAATREFKLPDDRWVEVNGAAIQTSPEQAGGAVLVFHDLTEIKRLQKTREEFVANVSHELRTPLSLIKGSAETLLETARGDQEATDRFLRMIDRNAERLRLLIEDLLAISEIESGRVRLSFREVKLRDLVEKVCCELSARAARTGARIINDVPELSIVADPNRLEQVFNNLVDNALKYGRRDGTIVVSAAVGETGFVRAEVRDDGPGIPPDSLDRIFERFYRVDKARSREQGGTGLGLAIVKHIVQSHGGKVWAESDPGQGAVFHMSLPLDGARERGVTSQASLPFV